MDCSAKSRYWLAAVLFSLLTGIDIQCPPASGAEPPRRVRIGDGSGYLSYPEAQVTLKLQPGETLYINPGTYSGLSLGNLSGTAAQSITVQCDPDTVFTTTTPQFNSFPNIAHVRFVGFRFETYKSTCLKITGRSHDVLFQDFTLRDVSGYSFYVYDPAKVFDGTKESTFYNFKWENVLIDGKTEGAAICNLNYSLSNMISVVLDFEVSRCTFRHFDNTVQAFPVIGLERCFNLHVHDCTFTDIGMAESRLATTSASASPAMRTRTTTASAASGPTTCACGRCS